MKQLRSRAAVVTTAALVVLAACSGEPVDDAAGTPAPSHSPSTEASTPVTTPSRHEQAALDRRLIAAAWDNDVARARRLIEDGADVNAQDDTPSRAPTSSPPVRAPYACSS